MTGAFDSTDGSVEVIAEAGVNHNGSLDTALALVDAAAEAGADTVKFQTFVPELLASAAAPKAPYQTARAGSGSQLDMLRRLSLDPEEHWVLWRRCRDRGIGFLSSPFDPVSARFLATELGLPRLKLGSGELTNGPLLLAIARRGTPLILSTGMADLDEVETALGVLAFGYGAPADAPPGRDAFRAAFASREGQTAIAERVTLLHCTTAYPCPLDEVNLRAMDLLAERFGLPVGYSDHTEGIVVSVAAAARGAVLIEKHFTLNRRAPGPDHAASLEPDGLRDLVQAVRQVQTALGGGAKAPTPAELQNREAARKGLVAACPIRAGEAFSPDSLAVKRPGTGRSPMDYWDLLGRPAPRDLAADEPI